MTVHIAHGQQFHMAEEYEDYVLSTQEVTFKGQSDMQAVFTWPAHPLYDNGPNIAVVNRPSDRYDHWMEASKKKP